MNVLYPKINQGIKLSEQTNGDIGQLQGNILQVSYTGCDRPILIKYSYLSCQRRVLVVEIICWLL